MFGKGKKAKTPANAANAKTSANAANAANAIPDGFTVDMITVEGSICTGERTIGFYDASTKSLKYAELVKSDEDIAAFYRKYGIE